MNGRLIAIGDIHGYSKALIKLLEIVAPQQHDVVVTLGDYCDRGPDTRGVIDLLIQLSSTCNLVPLIGNHDQMLLEVAWGAEELLAEWLDFGGAATLASYGLKHPAAISKDHLNFLQACPHFFETERHFFVHANYLEDWPLNLQPPEVLFWESLKIRTPGPHQSGKIAILGHTAQASGEILDLRYLKCLDTCCYGGGWLTAMEVYSGEIWQVDASGCPRKIRPHLVKDS